MVQPVCRAKKHVHTRLSVLSSQVVGNQCLVREELGRAACTEPAAAAGLCLTPSPLPMQ